MGIVENLADINMRISRAAEKSGRCAKDITLVGVTKTVDIQRIGELLDQGVTQLGENRVQELMSKYDILSKYRTPPEWHLIGSLQTNKVKYIVDKVFLIHSVDSFRLAEEIDRRAAAAGKVMDILVEVNIAGEISKHGVTLETAAGLVAEIQRLRHISIKGLMTIAPFVENPEENREYFYKMRKLYIDINEKPSNNVSMTVLSMGMTNDYEIAIEEGSTMVRIGTGIFGTR